MKDGETDKSLANKSEGRIVAGSLTAYVHHTPEMELAIPS
jgi:hypothetical protein